jgi:hypothetical protein
VTETYINCHFGGLSSLTLEIYKTMVKRVDDPAQLRKKEFPSLKTFSQAISASPFINLV